MNGTHCLPPGGCVSRIGDGPCEAGYYCPMGSWYPTQRPCCDARRDDATGLWTRHGNGDTVDVVRLVSNEDTPRHLHSPPGEVFDVDGWHQCNLGSDKVPNLYFPRYPRSVDTSRRLAGMIDTVPAASISIVRQEVSLQRTCHNLAHSLGPSDKRVWIRTGSHPKNVTRGSYAVGGNRTTRSAVLACAGNDARTATCGVQWRDS